MTTPGESEFDPDFMERLWQQAGDPNVPGVVPIDALQAIEAVRSAERNERAVRQIVSINRARVDQLFTPPYAETFAFEDYADDATYAAARAESPTVTHIGLHVQPKPFAPAEDESEFAVIGFDRHLARDAIQATLTAFSYRLELSSGLGAELFACTDSKNRGFYIVATHSLHKPDAGDPYGVVSIPAYTMHAYRHIEDALQALPRNDETTRRRMHELLGQPVSVQLDRRQVFRKFGTWIKNLFQLPDA